MKWTKLTRLLVNPALVAQRIEHLTTDQKVRGSNPFERALVGRKVSNENTCSWFNWTYWFLCRKSA